MSTMASTTTSISTSEKNKAAVQRLYQALDQGDATIVETLFAPEWENIDPALPPMRGLDGARTLVALFNKSFPDFTTRIELIAAEDERVAVHATHTGTHRGDFLGIPATGKRFSVSSSGIFTLRDGKLLQNRVIFDAYGLFQQLGIAP